MVASSAWRPNLVRYFRMVWWQRLLLRQLPCSAVCRSRRCLSTRDGAGWFRILFYSEEHGRLCNSLHNAHATTMTCVLWSTPEVYAERMHQEGRIHHRSRDGGGGGGYRRDRRVAALCGTTEVVRAIAAAMLSNGQHAGTMHRGIKGERNGRYSGGNWSHQQSEERADSSTSGAPSKFSERGDTGALSS